MFWQKKLSKEEKKVLCSLLKGGTLKSHRYLDGTKVYKNHPLSGPSVEVTATVVSRLKRKGLIASNQKFPAATYLLTEKGQLLAQTLIKTNFQPLYAQRRN